MYIYINELKDNVCKERISPLRIYGIVKKYAATFICYFRLSVPAPVSKNIKLYFIILKTKKKNKKEIEMAKAINLRPLKYSRYTCLIPFSFICFILLLLSWFTLYFFHFFAGITNLKSCVSIKTEKFV